MSGTVEMSCASIDSEPKPPGRPLVRMCWHDLLFVHWRVSAAQLEGILPQGLTPDIYDGSAWVGLVPFTMTGVRPLGIGVPTARNFHECNVRTYVKVGGVPGVYFLSLDAASTVAAKAARFAYGLPYFRARIDLARCGDRIAYRVSRCGHAAAACELVWQLGAPLAPATNGGLDWFLTERYSLFLRNRHGRVCRGRIWHPRWRLRQAQLLRIADGLVAAAGISLSGAPDSVLASDGTAADAWGLTPSR
jgi:hypothetical protein